MAAKLSATQLLERINTEVAKAATDQRAAAQLLRDLQSFKDQTWDSSTSDREMASRVFRLHSFAYALHNLSQTLRDIGEAQRARRFHDEAQELLRLLNVITHAKTQPGALDAKQMLRRALDGKQ